MQNNFMQNLRELKNIRLILTCNIIGLVLLLSLSFTLTVDLWYELDRAVFYFFNRLLAESGAFLYFTAAVNLTGFYLAAFLLLLAVFYAEYRLTNVEGKRWFAAIGIAALLGALVVKQLAGAFAWSRVSPTTYFDNLYHDAAFVSRLTGWPVNDALTSCYPDGAGIILLVCCAFFWRYLGRGAFIRALVITVIFSFFPVMGGAHWLTDFFIGSLGYVLIFLTWIIFTPLADTVIDWLEEKLPLDWFEKRRESDGPRFTREKLEEKVNFFSALLHFGAGCFRVVFGLLRTWFNAFLSKYNRK